MPTASHRDIVEQADTLGATLAAVASGPLDGLDAARPWVLTGCGASYHAATAAAAALGGLARTAAAACPASDLWMNPELWLRPDVVVVGMSRTGTTTETVQALRTARAAGATTVGISLTARTPLVEEVDHPVVLDHVDERGRVMTRSFSNLLLAAQALAVRSALASGGRDDALLHHYRQGLEAVPAAVAASADRLDAQAREIARDGCGHVVFLGSGTDVGLCRQAALQTQETARPAVEAHAVLDYRHGPIATLTEDSMVVLVTTERSLSADLVLADDVATLGGRLVAVGPAAAVEQMPGHVTGVAVDGEVPPWLRGNLALPFLQLLGYHLTRSRGADPESVRNLDRTKTPHVDPHVLREDLFARTTG